MKVAGSNPVSATKFNHLPFVRVGDAGEKGRRVVKCGVLGRNNPDEYLSCKSE